MPRTFLATLLLLNSITAFGEEITLGPESTIHRNGEFIELRDGRSKTEYLVRVDKILFVSGAKESDMSAYSEIKVGLKDSDNNATVIRVQNRIMPYATIKAAIAQ